MTQFDTLDRTTDEMAVLELLRQMGAAWDAGDPDAFADLYAEDARVATPGTFSQGREQIRAFVTAGFAGPLKGTKSVERPQHIRFLADNVAIVDSLSGYTRPGEQGVQPSLERRATWVLSRSDAGWLVESYHNCPAHQN